MDKHEAAQCIYERIQHARSNLLLSTEQALLSVHPQFFESLLRQAACTWSERGDNMFN